MTPYIKIHHCYVRRKRRVENRPAKDTATATKQQLGTLKAAGRQTGFVNAVEFNLLAAILVFAMIIIMAVAG